MAAKLHLTIRDIDLRTLNFLKGGFANIFYRFFSGVLGLLIVPLLIEHLGVESFGLWVLITTSIYLLGSLDLGFPQILINETAKWRQNNQISKVASLILLLQLVISFMLLVVFGILRLTDIVPLEVFSPDFALIVCLIALLHTISSMVIPVRVGLEEAEKNGIYGTIGVFLNFGLLYFAVWTKQDFLFFIFAAFLGHIIANIINALDLFLARGFSLRF